MNCCGTDDGTGGSWGLDGKPMPAADGAVIEVRRSDRTIPKGQEGHESVLQVSWFGSGCHLFQLGEASVLTDPFVTNGFGIFIKSDPAIVAETLARIAPPDAVIVNHTHFDHFLDAYPVMAQKSWREAGVTLHGGQSCKNLLAGWQDQEVLDRCHVIDERGGEVLNKTLASGHQLRITAYESEHTPHLHCGGVLLSGKVERPRKSPPDSINDYKAGEVFNFLIEIGKPGGSSFRIFYLAAPNDLDDLPNSIPADLEPVDLAILSIPGAKNVEHYPGQHLARLRPRHVILNHFNNCLSSEPDRYLTFLGIDLARLNEFSRKVQDLVTQHPSLYRNFEMLHIPALTVMESQGLGRNVVHIRK